jgi:hypothetical protein
MQYKYWMVHSPGGGPANKQYDDMSEAITEARRLASASPGKRFCVLESALCYEVRQPEPVVVRIETRPALANEVGAE